MEVNFKSVGLILNLAVVLAWLIRWVAVPQGYLTIPVSPTPAPTPVIPIFPEVPKAPYETWISISSLIIGLIGMYVTPRIKATKIEELHMFDVVGIAFNLVSIYLSLWGAWLIA